MNSQLKNLISIPENEASADDDELLVEELKKAQLIMPIEITSHEEDDFQFTPLKLADYEEKIFIPLFTDEDELIKSDVEFSVINIYTKNLAEMVNDSGDEYFGVAINPFSEFQLKIPLREFLELFKNK